MLLQELPVSMSRRPFVAGLPSSYPLLGHKPALSHHLRMKWLLKLCSEKRSAASVNARIQ
jgi:hypothetical protein